MSGCRSLILSIPCSDERLDAVLGEYQKNEGAYLRACPCVDRRYLCSRTGQRRNRLEVQKTSLKIWRERNECGDLSASRYEKEQISGDEAKAIATVKAQ